VGDRGRGGIPRPAVTVDTDAGETTVGWPEFLPDGRRFLYVVTTGNGNSRLMLGELDSDEKTYVMDVDSRVEYAEPGYLIYVRDDTLVVQPFDADTGRIEGDPRPIAQQMGIDEVGLADFSAARNGALVYRAEGSAVRRLVWRDRSGRELGSVGTPAAHGDIWLSPDDGRVAVDTVNPGGEGSDLWIHDVERGVDPHWSHDGREIFYLDADDRLTTVAVQTSPAFRAGLPETLFDAEVFPGTFRSRYALAADGERFLLLSRTETQTVPPLTVVMNWTAALFD
jgi:hypothetical protein